jgi:uridine kinase
MTTTDPHLIGIAGPSGGGKTALADALRGALGEAVPVVPLDAYYRDTGALPPEQRVARNFDHPDAIDDALLVDQLQVLAAGRPVDRPIYDFSTHRRLAETVHVVPASFVVVEGLLTFYWPRLRQLLGTRIFLDAEDELCLARRIARDTTERGRTEASVRQQWESTVRPMFGRYVEPTAAYADAVCDGDRPLDEIVDDVTRRFGW